MKNLVVLFFSFLTVTTCTISCFTQEIYMHKSEDKIVAMLPAQKIDEFLKERYYHGPFDTVDEVTAGRDQGVMINDHIRKDGVKALPALAYIANRYNPDQRENYEEAIKFEIAFHLAKDIDNIVVRIRSTDEGRSAIKVFEDVLNRIKNAGYAGKKHRWNQRYLAYLDTLRILQGKDTSLTDENIRATLREKHNIQMSNEQMVTFSNYLTSLDPTYPSRCKINFPPLLTCKDFKEYYEAYFRYNAERY